MSGKSLKSIILAMVLILYFTSACGQNAGRLSPSENINEEILFSDCKLSVEGIATRLDARCGTMDVDENPDEPSGKKIALKIAVIPALSRNPASDPLFFLAGGPGQSAIESYLMLENAFTKINQKRDVVLVDQRGTGASNPLKCPTLSDESIEENDIQEMVSECLNKIDGDPGLYTTTIAMKDLDLIRSALGYAQINLYGVSYGTRAALSYIQLFPQNVRTVILDGVVPQDVALGMNVARDAQRALDRMFTRCQQDNACQTAFPNLEDEFYELIGRLQTSPVTVALTDPVNAERVEQEFDLDQFSSTIRLLSYTTETVALIPFLIHNAYQYQDFSNFAAQYRIVSRQLSPSISFGMSYSVLCTEDYPYFDNHLIEQMKQDTYYGDLQIRALDEICAIWPQGVVPSKFKQPVIAEMPVLLLSGEDDPVTPPENADQVAQGLSNSLSIVVRGQGHNVINRGCLPDVAFRFIEAGSVENLDLSCIQTIRAAPFFINANGTAP